MRKGIIVRINCENHSRDGQIGTTDGMRRGWCYVKFPDGKRIPFLPIDLEDPCAPRRETPRLYRVTKEGNKYHGRVGFISSETTACLVLEFEGRITRVFMREDVEPVSCERIFEALIGNCKEG